MPAVLLALGLAAACGKRGNPQAPIRPVPAAVTNLSARRIGDRVEIRFVVPSENRDGSAPPAISAVEIYGAAGPPAPVQPAPFAMPPVPLSIPIGGTAVPVVSAPLAIGRFSQVQLAEPSDRASAGGRANRVTPAATTVAAILTSKYLRARIAVRPPPKPLADGEAAPGQREAPPDTRPGPGMPASFSEQIDAARAAAAASPDVSVLRYVVVGVAGGHRLGAPSPVLEVPLTLDVAPPTGLAASYDETTLKLAWTAGAPAQSYRVYRADSQGAEEPSPLDPAPLTAPTFSLPVELGREQCFTVRAVAARGPASVDSDPAGPLCIRPVDTFPPPAPTGLSGLPTETQIQLLWTPVLVSDLAGYLVLRGQDGSTPVPITADPLPEPRYTDTKISPGVRYTYAVVAVDKAGNRSQPSSTIDETR